MADALRRLREAGADVEDISTPPEPPENAPQWRPGAPPPVKAVGPVMATALRSRNLPNRKRLMCQVHGKDVSVLVRDTAFYRQGEEFEVRLNDYNEWEAAAHRTQPRYR